MKIRLFHTLTSLVFCVGSVILLTGPAQYGFLLALGISVMLTVMQKGIWLVSPRKACISYSLAFIPPCLFEVGVVRSCPPLYAVGLLYMLVYMFVPAHRLPALRPSTSLWLGSLIYMVEFSLLAGVLV